MPLEGKGGRLIKPQNMKGFSMDVVKELEELFDRVHALPADQQFLAWNGVMAWLQHSIPLVAAYRRMALHQYGRDSGLTRRELADKFNLTFTTVSRLLDEADKSEIPSA